jgi:hypothetical protein
MVSFGNLLERGQVQLGNGIALPRAFFAPAGRQPSRFADRLQSHTGTFPLLRIRILEGKPRTIDAPTIGDCVVHHAAMKLLERVRAALYRE